MAALEVLALNTSTPRIEAPQAGDTYTMPRPFAVQGITVGLGGSAVVNNLALGLNALFSNTTGSFNTAVGRTALLSNTTGANSVAVGSGALSANTTGASNTAVGQAALTFNTTGFSNVAVGHQTLQGTLGSSNTAVGAGALVANTTGANNVAIGAQADAARTAGDANIVIGFDIDADSPTGSNQINIGGVYFHDRLLYTERADPAAPAANQAVVYARDNGGGKTQLCVRFATGAVQVLATQP